MRNFLAEIGVQFEISPIFIAHILYWFSHAVEGDGDDEDGYGLGRRAHRPRPGWRLGLKSSHSSSKHICTLLQLLVAHSTLRNTAHSTSTSTGHTSPQYSTISTEAARLGAPAPHLVLQDTVFKPLRESSWSFSAIFKITLQFKLCCASCAECNCAQSSSLRRSILPQL